jgi:hypothetical protein
MLYACQSTATFIISVVGKISRTLFGTGTDTYAFLHIEQFYLIQRPFEWFDGLDPYEFSRG